MSFGKGKLGSVFVSEGASVQAVGASMSLDTGYTYKPTLTTQRYWDQNKAVLVYENGILSTKAYTIEYPGGRVVFPSTPSTPVTATFYYFSVKPVGGCRNWEISNVGLEIVDVSEFQHSWHTRETILGDFSASVERIKLDNQFADLTTLPDDLIIVLYEQLNGTLLIDPWTTGNFELDNNDDGIANLWSEYKVSTPTGTIALVSGDAFAGTKYQRITVTAAPAGVSKYGIQFTVTGDGNVGDRMFVEVRYKTNAVPTLGLKVAIGTTVNDLTASTTWTRAVFQKLYAGVESRNCYIYIESSGSFTGSEMLEVDYVRLFYLPSGNARKRWEGYGRLTPRITSAVTGILENAVSIVGNGPLYYRTDDVAFV